MTTTHLLTIALSEHVDPLIAENLTAFVHRLIPGSHTVGSLDLTDTDLTDFEWDEETPAFPLTSTQATPYADTEGVITVVTTIDQDRYMRWFAQGVSGADVNHHDLVHNQVFDFGMPYDSTLNILAVSGSDFIVSYTTALVDPDEEI